MKPIAIVGAGISGLVVAYRLHKAGYPVLLFEKASHVGGTIDTEFPGETVLERGPDSFLRRKTALAELAQDLGMEKELIATNASVKGAYIFLGGQMFPIPVGLQAGLPTQIRPLLQSRLLTRAGKRRLMRDLMRPPLFAKGESESDMALGRFLRYRFGNEMVQRLIAPMLSGIYAGDIDAMSLLATFPHLRDLERQYGSLIAAGQALGQKQLESPTSPFITFGTGNKTLVETLVQQLPQDQVLLNHKIERIFPDNGQWHIQSPQGHFDVSAVVLATPAYVTQSLVSFMEENVRHLLTIPYANLAIIGAVYPWQLQSIPWDKTGFLVPEGQGMDLTAVTWVSSKWAYPQVGKKKVLRAFYGRAQGPDILAKSNERLLARFLGDMTSTMGITEKPLYHTIIRLPQSMPQYQVGHPFRMQELYKALRSWRGLYVTGAAYEGVGVPDCIRHANHVAEQVRASL